MTIDRQLSIRELTLADAPSYRDIRLEGLRLAPEAFGSSYEEEISRSDEEFARRITGRPGIMFGGFDPGAAGAAGAAAGAAGAAGLVGTAGCYCDNAVKSRHKLLLVGMYVRPAYRGRGLGARLIERILQHAREIGGIAGLVIRTADGSIFSIDGKVLSGPAPRPLDRLVTKIDQGKILIGTEIQKA